MSQQHDEIIRYAILGLESEERRIADEMAKLRGQLAGKPVQSETGRPARKPLSAAARKRIAAAQRARWAKQKKQSKNAGA